MPNLLISSAPCGGVSCICVQTDPHPDSARSTRPLRPATTLVAGRRLQKHTGCCLRVQKSLNTHLILMDVEEPQLLQLCCCAGGLDLLQQPAGTGAQHAVGWI